MADQDLTRGHAAGIARGAAVIAGFTVLSRILGLVRTLVFSQRVGASCLGTAYITANQVPNLVYELVVGGALTSAMLPVLGRGAGHLQPRGHLRVPRLLARVPGSPAVQAAADRRAHPVGRHHPGRGRAGRRGRVAHLAAAPYV